MKRNAKKMKKTELNMNKPVYLDFSILDLSKIAIKIRIKYHYKLYYIDIDSFIIT